MTRGPVHEAYAQPVNSGAVQPLVVSRKPPAPIEEMPPDVKPAEANAVWLGGYWAWDDDRKDFLWTSGVWRVPPAGRQWVAGYWSKVASGYQWVAGFWSPLESQEVSYYPAPPASVEAGPTSEPPSVDHLWIPGCWRWRTGRYLWQPGFWEAGQPDYVWVPASYCWTPHGWVYADGYWDYPVASRGVLFAPVYFAADFRLRPHYRFLAPGGHRSRRAAVLVIHAAAVLPLLFWRLLRGGV